MEVGMLLDGKNFLFFLWWVLAEICLIFEQLQEGISKGAWCETILHALTVQKEHMLGNLSSSEQGQKSLI